MSAFNLLSRTTICFARTSCWSQTNRMITGCLPTGVVSFNRNFRSAHSQRTLTYPINNELRFLAAKPSLSIHELTKYYSKPFSTKVPTSPDKLNTQDKKKLSAASDATNVDELIFSKTSKLTQFEKFKLMYRKYWYVLIPVHVATSLGWIFGFYYLSKSGFDIPSILETIHLSETIIEKVKNSDMGHYAIAYLCYKIITPFRYAATLGLTTVTIKRLAISGSIKPMPTKKEFMQMYKAKKAIRAKRREEAILQRTGKSKHVPKTQTVAKKHGDTKTQVGSKAQDDAKARGWAMMPGGAMTQVEVKPKDCVKAAEMRNEGNVQVQTPTQHGTETLKEIKTLDEVKRQNKVKKLDELKEVKKEVHAIMTNGVKMQNEQKMQDEGKTQNGEKMEDDVKIQNGAKSS